jgi:hypothetical protein
MVVRFLQINSGTCLSQRKTFEIYTLSIIANLSIYRRFQNGVGWYIWIKKKIPDYRTITGRLQDENRT